MTFIKSIWKSFKKYWKVILGITLVCLSIYFLIHSKAELQVILTVLRKANKEYIFWGLAMTVIYILLQGLIYYFSFRSLEGRISILKCIILFIKRFSLSIFLPGGGLAAIAFFNSQLANEKTPVSKVSLGSIIFGFTGIISGLLFSLPGFIFLASTRLFNKKAIWQLAGIILFIGIIILVLHSLYKRSWAFRLAKKIDPNLDQLVKEMELKNFNKKELLKALGASLLLDCSGVIILLISMLALGHDAQFEEAFIGYITATIIMIISPLIKGSGPVEISLALILKRYGLPWHLAILSSLIYRLFTIWVPAFVGGLSFIFFPYKKDEHPSNDIK